MFVQVQIGNREWESEMENGMGGNENWKWESEMETIMTQEPC